MYNLTKDEAIRAMLDGYKVAHRYFSDDEYIYMVNGVIKTEDGYPFENELERRTEEVWLTDWCIYKGGK